MLGKNAQLFDLFEKYGPSASSVFSLLSNIELTSTADSVCFLLFRIEKCQSYSTSLATNLNEKIAGENTIPKLKETVVFILSATRKKTSV